MIRILTILLSLIAFAAMAHAAYVPVVPTYSPNVWPYVPPTPGSVPQAKDRPDHPGGFDTAPWLASGSNPNPPNGEAKFRTLCNYSHHRYDDPIVFPGQRGVSHLHTFFGNTLTKYNSTYRSLRIKGDSTCGGGPLNRSAYWYPALLKDNALGDGRTLVLKPDYATVYYTINETDVALFTRFYRGMSMVFGFNPKDPNDDKTKAEINAANNGDPNGIYRYGGNGFMGWKCELTNGANANSPLPGSPLQPYLANADGTPTLTCPATERIAAVLGAPICWDGAHLGSPDGRTHVRQPLSHKWIGAKNICPAGWFKLPKFDLIIWFSHTGPDDYSKWYLSSDRMPVMNHTFRNGETMHADWFGAWDWATMVKWMRHCNGLTFDGMPGVPHSCIDTQFGDGTKGAGGHLTTRRWADQGAARFDDTPRR